MYYVYSSRFQPLNLLIEEELKWLSKNISQNDRIIIGIVNPNPKLANPGDKADSWTRFKPQFNPLNYWERYCMIDNFLCANTELQQKVKMICPLPRPSVNIISASNYLPPSSERVMCLQVAQENAQEEQKRTGLEQQGETIFEIPSYGFDPFLTVITPELLCCLMALGSQDWPRFVSENTKECIENLEVIDRVLQLFRRREAINHLRRIYNRESTAYEQAILYPVCEHLITGIDKPNVSVNGLQISTTSLINEIKKLVGKMEDEFVVMRAMAPDTHEKFSKKRDELLKIIEDLEKNRITEEDARVSMDSIIVDWEKRH